MKHFIINTKVQFLNSDPVPETVVETIGTIQRSQNNRYYFAIPQLGSYVGTIKLRSEAFTAMPNDVSQYTLTDGLYTATGGNYITKGTVTYDADTKTLTIRDTDCNVLTRANSYILIGYYSATDTADIIE